GRLFPDTEISIRVNLGFGYGYHEFTTTGGLTKFGIGLDSLGRALEIAREYRLKVIGLHSHVGSGILTVEPYARVTKLLLNLAKNLPGIEFVDIGGGMGIPQKPGDGEFNCVEFGRVISELVEEYSKSFGGIKLRIEPGRFIVGNAGVLLAKVVEVKEVSEGGSRKLFVMVDSSVNHLIRSVLMDVYYEVVAVSKANSPREVEVDIVGNLCMTGDVLAKARKMPRLEEGDVLAFMNAGAYTYSTSSNYNMRPRPAEVLVCGGRAKLTRRRERFSDLIATLEI
ncbi:MAG: hypothetical protein RMH84_06975, partial [Sulfolobales archaeon]|nr:hypothetical protein [Sulfolobales archaeon]